MQDSCQLVPAGALVMNLDLPMIIEFPIALIVGGLVASLFGVIIGVPVLRLRGNYLAITLAFGEIIKSIVNSEDNQWGYRIIRN